MKEDPISKTTNTKGTGGMAQQGLEFNPSTAKKKKKKIKNNTDMISITTTQPFSHSSKAARQNM
jgi:hypothetical protein